MEPVTHFLTGACIGRAGLNRRTAYATLAATLAAEAPDMDVFWSFGGGWGTRASRPFGVNGVITMKIISSTSNTSISGVTFMFAFWPPLGPTAIAISISSAS